MKLVIELLLLAILSVGSYTFGAHTQRNADIAEQAEQRDIENEIARHRNKQSTAAGIRTEKAQAKTDAFFQKLRADYETDQHNHPGIGCVLDADSLLRWNQANTQSGDGTAGQPDGEVSQDAAATQSR